MSRLKRLAPPAAGIAVLLLVWYLVCRMEIFNAYVLPSPGKVLDSFQKMLLSGEIFQDISIAQWRRMGSISGTTSPG